MANSAGITRGNIGKIQDNRIEDIDLARRILMCGKEALMLGRKGKPKTVEELEDRFNEYLEICVNFGLPPTVEGMGLSIHVDRRTLYNWETERQKRRVWRHRKGNEGLYC